MCFIAICWIQLHHLLLDWKFDMAIPDDIRYLYYLESGFYFHALYATVFMDVWKKDSIAMLIHHVLANALIIFSMATRLGFCVAFLNVRFCFFLLTTLEENLLADLMWILMCVVKAFLQI